MAKRLSICLLGLESLDGVRLPVEERLNPLALWRDRHADKLEACADRGTSMKCLEHDVGGAA